MSPLLLRLFGVQEHEYALTAGLSYAVVDEKFSVGIEGETAVTDVKGDRGNYNHTTLVGPSLQYRPLPNMHVDFAPLMGVVGDKKAKILFNMGWEF